MLRGGLGNLRPGVPRVSDGVRDLGFDMLRCAEVAGVLRIWGSKISTHARESEIACLLSG